MVKMTVLFGHPDDPAAFDRHFSDTHLPLFAKVKERPRFELARTVGAPDGGPAAYYQIAEMWFDSLEAMHQVLESSEMKTAVKDLENFATGGVTIFASELVKVHM